ncbi:exodeoxyribonuclease VII small subunit [Nitrococcus mobilis]|uniref:Exodeoxyribonuclease 7 small subunit n=1 Tax=Nitrococcus mobilis Nb-231 TaxID=314278 RepID=A4BSY3_9GAMM|nr:exodeoxyribonuclease VII small subunit [Nitrococcus mobilis]EAR21227.1 exodeoxyribonuclease VII, small subunit [Nitrococcus mobilis Nb-231]
MIQPSDTEFDFEHALQELEELVGRMESGELSLEDSLKSFERGIELTRACQKVLREAEQKIEILLGQDESAVTMPFEAINHDGS